MFKMIGLGWGVTNLGLSPKKTFYIPSPVLRYSKKGIGNMFFTE